MRMKHQLSIVYRHNGPTHRAFVMARDRWDFSDEDLAVARVVQRSLAALDHQVAMVQRMTGARGRTDLGLTGRELAVLQLVAEGATTRRASRALAGSPRTVEKHQNAYRRLAGGPQHARAATAAYLRSGRSGSWCCRRSSSTKPAARSCSTNTSTGQR